jgi:hypothetical protein
MNYYEELGIRADADEEEIRKAHRRLVKLMHPDQHRDQALKQLAETQMRRLNSIVSTLLDPEERQEYDEQLRGGDALHQAPQQSTWRSVPWWIASTLGAIVLTVAAVWFFADRIGSGFHPRPTPTNVEDLEKPNNPGVTTVQVPPTPPITAKPSVEPEKPESSQPNANSPDRTVASVTVPPVEKPKPVVVDKRKDSFPPVPAAPKEKLVVKATPPLAPVIQKPSTVKVVKMPAQRPDTTAKKEYPVVARTPKPPVVKAPAAPPVTQPPAATTVAKDTPPVAEPPVRKLPDVPEVRPQAPKEQPTLDAGLRPPTPLAGGVTPRAAGDIPTAPPVPIISPSSRSRDPLEGEWVYAPTEPEKRKPGFYPPEFIQLKLRKDTSGMRGEYSARYNVADNRPVSPNVNFVLKAVDNKALKYVWTAADGSHGWFVIKNLEPDTMRLEWRATSSRGGPALTSGMATLVRKN